MITYLKSIDMRMLMLLNRRLRNRLLDRIMPIITALGNGGIVWMVISIFLIKNEKYKSEGYMIITSLILTSVIGEGVIKHMIKRTRPFTLMKEKKLLIAKPITYSFPSGHTASSFAAAGIFFTMNNKLSIFVVILASLIAFSRVYLNVHYPTDVVTGIILGLLCSRMVVAIFQSEIISYLNFAYKHLIYD